MQLTLSIGELIQSGQILEYDGVGAQAPAPSKAAQAKAVAAARAFSNRCATSAQFTTFHQAAT